MLSVGFLPESPSSAHPDYVDDACILPLSNSPKGRNRTERDRVTARAKEYRRGERLCAQERAPLRGAMGEISNFYSLSARLLIFNTHIPPIINTHTSKFRSCLSDTF